MPKSSSKRGLVLVTGGSGYVAGYCIAELLNNGWRVRSTVRSSAKVKAVRASISNIGSNASEIEFVEADLNSDAGWSQATGGAQYVLHVASPVPVTDPKNDDELVRPARDGTLRVLKAARDDAVKRVVMTSSISAIIFGRGVREQPFTEEDWTDETNRGDTSPYDRAKTIAERAAWAWLASEGGGLELVAVNPGLVLGPVLGADYSASIEFVKKLLDGSIPALPVQRGRCARRRAPTSAGDDNARSCGAAFCWLRRFLLDVRRRQDTQAGTWRSGEEGSIHSCARFCRADGGAVRSDCPGPALRTGEKATRFVGEGQASVGLDTAPDHRDRPRHCTKPSGKRPGLSDRPNDGRTPQVRHQTPPFDQVHAHAATLLAVGLICFGQPSAT